MDKKILRLIDANINRLLEGLRVCEDIERFIAGSRKLTAIFKRLRHKITATTKDWDINSRGLLDSRNSLKDIGKASIEAELKRNNYKDIFYANIQRSKESIRVLEEFAKLNNKKVADKFKDIRYRLYQVEKEAISRLRLWL